MAKDCTEERKWQCRNCDEWGHKSRECPKPLDGMLISETLIDAC